MHFMVQEKCHAHHATWSQPGTLQRIQQLALEEHISLNKAALKLLAKGAGVTVSRKTVIGQDLDHLFGTWKESDAEQFLDLIKSCEQIDAAFWT